MCSLMHTMKRLVAVAVLVALLVACGSDVQPRPRKALVFDRDGWVWQARIDGTHQVRVTRGEHPDISPDGRWILFWREADFGEYELRVVASSGGKSTLVSSDVDDSTWVPDSTRFLFVNAEGVHIARPGGSPSRLLEPQRTTQGGCSGVSTNESIVVLTCATRSGTSDLYSVPLSGGRLHRLTNFSLPVRALVRGDRILFVVDRGTWDEIWRMKVDGSKRRRLAGAGDPGITLAAWFPDGRHLIGRSENRMLIFDSITGTRHPVPGVQNWEGPLALSRDGRMVLARQSTFCDYTNTAGYSQPVVRLNAISVADGDWRELAQGSCFADWNA
jgi:hypothetical protein